MNRATFHHSRPRGLSLLEVLIAVGLMAVAMGVTGLLVTRPQRLIDSTNERLTEGAQADLALHEMARMLGQTHVMKTGLLACDGNTFGTARQAQAPITLAANGDSFNFAYSAYSSLVALSSTSTTDLLVTDASRYPLGSLVLVTHINDPTFGGLFRVRDVEPAENRISVALLGGTTAPGVSCRAVAGASSNLSQLATDPSHRIFNSQPTTFRADRVHFASYSLETHPTQRTRFNVMFRQWPHPSSTEDQAVQSRLAVERVVDLTITAGWNADGTSGAADSGIFSADFRVRRDETSAGARTGSGITRDLAGRVTYPLGGSLRRNFGAPTTPASAAIIFPTCALAASPLNGVFRKKDDPTRSLNLVRVDVLTSGLGGRVGSIDAVLVAGATATECWPSNQVNAFDFTGRLAELNGLGQTSALSIAPSSGGGYEPIYCDLPAGGSITAQMVYYDDTARRLRRVPCTGASSNLSGSFTYQGPATSCDSDSGLIEFGRLVDSGGGGAGPVLYVDETSCLWSDSASYQSCRHDDGATLVNPNRSLRRVALRPAGISITNGTNEVTCN